MGETVVDMPAKLRVGRKRVNTGSTRRDEVGEASSIAWLRRRG